MFYRHVDSLLPLFRCDFEEEGLRGIADRSERLQTIISTERANLAKYQQHKSAKEAEIASSLEVIEGLKEELAGLQQALEEKTKAVEQVKKTTSKAGKVLDQALKEIATAVSQMPSQLILLAWDADTGTSIPCQ